jgi:K+-transporting ATPase c subunit
LPKAATVSEGTRVVIHGLFGRPVVNVLQMNLALRKLYGAPS